MVCQRLCLVSLILIRLLVWFRLCKGFSPKADMRLSFGEICCVTATNICLQLPIPIETKLMLCSFAVSFLAFLLCLFGSFLCFALYLSVMHSILAVLLGSLADVLCFATGLLCSLFHFRSVALYGFARFLSVALHCATCPMCSLLYFRFVAPKVSFHLLSNSANLSLCSRSFLTGVCGLSLYCCRA